MSGLADEEIFGFAVEGCAISPSEADTIVVIVAFDMPLSCLVFDNFVIALFPEHLFALFYGGFDLCGVHWAFGNILEGETDEPEDEP